MKSGLPSSKNGPFQYLMKPYSLLKLKLVSFNKQKAKSSFVLQTPTSSSTIANKHKIKLWIKDQGILFAKLLR